MDTDDSALIEKCRAGDVAAFEPLVEKYRQRVWRLAYNVLRDREEAWDVAQEAFIKAYQALPSFRGQSAFYTWLYRIAMNVAADRARSRAAQGRAFGTERVPEEDWERVITDPNPAEASPADTAVRREERRKIMQALDQLSEDHRRIIMLGDLEGLSYREIAETLEIPMGTVMSRLHNARKRLRDVLGPLLMLVLALLLTLATPAAAQAPGAQAPIVRFGARVLMGTDGPLPSGLRAAPADGDERLVAFMPKLRQLFRYKEYASLERYRAEVPVGTLQTWRVPGERTLEVWPESVAGDTVRMRVRLIRGQMTELVTEIRAARGSPAVIGGPRYGDGVIIIIVWANANPSPAPR
ncbi:MAG: sigma-70 family RNA polymerase sigma factor [Candidatus Rokuibacteriota bacterium]|nr:sigma-70 family RNA polymerase sigma factor [Patescibacteria group bacterium]